MPATTILLGGAMVQVSRVEESQQEFMDRFPAEVRSMIHTHSIKDTPVGAAIREALLRFQVAKHVERTDPRTISSTTQLITLAVSLGVVAPENAQAMITTILEGP